MSILIIGGDQISQISSMLTQMGAKTINHWDARKKSSAPKKKVPQDTDCIVMLTSFLNHNTMLKCWDAKNLATECIHTWPADAL